MLPRRGLAAAVLALAACVGACAGASANSPRGALRAYANALADGRADDAYALLSDEAKAQISREAFREMVKKNREEALELGKALSKETSDPYVTATIPLKNGDVVTLVYEDGKWRVDGAALEFYSQATPRQALVGFIRAFKKKRWDVLLKYTPDAHKEGLTPERLASAWEEGKPEGNLLVETIKRIEEVLPTAQIEETGDRAAMTWGTGSVLFVREHGAWKIEDIKQ